MGLRLGLIPPQGITRVSATDVGFRPPSVLACSSLPGGRAGLLHSSLPTVFDARKDRGSVVRARSNSGYYWQTQAEFYPTPPPPFFLPPLPVPPRSNRAIIRRRGELQLRNAERWRLLLGSQPLSVIQQMQLALRCARWTRALAGENEKQDI